MAEKDPFSEEAIDAHNALSKAERFAAIRESKAGEFVHPEPPPLRHPIETIPPVDASTIENIAREESQDPTEVDSLPSVTQGDSAAIENPPEAHDLSYADHLRRPGSTVEEDRARRGDAVTDAREGMEERGRNERFREDSASQRQLNDLRMQGIINDIEDVSAKASSASSVIADMGSLADVTSSEAPSLWAKIDSHVSGGAYTWDEVRRNSADTGWETFTGNLTHDTEGNALEVSEKADVPSGTIVLLKSEVDADGLETFYFSASTATTNKQEVYDEMGGDGPDPREPVTVAGSFWAELTDSGSGSPEVYAWKEIINTNGVWSDVAGAGRTSSTSGEATAYHHNNWANLRTGLRVLMRPVMDSSDNVEYVFWVPNDNIATSGSTRLSTFAAAFTGSGGSEVDNIAAADSITWDIADQGGLAGLQLPITSRVAYDDSEGTPKLLGYARTLTFDAGGRLMAVTGETSYVIDTPEEC